jgi:hypothetical protein
MKRLEDELRNAMRREEPPEGFFERTLARTSAPRQNAWAGIVARHGMRWALAGALCLVLAVGGMEFRRAEAERARGEAARAQLILALRITADKLQFAQAKAQQHGISLIY